MHRTKRPEDRNAIAVVDRGIQTLKKDLATRVARKGGQTLSGRPGPTTRGPTRRCTARPRTWRSSRPQSSGSCKTTPAQQGPHRPAREGGGCGRLPSADERGEELQPGAAGQRQRGGPADETGQAGGCEAAGRLPGASEAQDPRLASFENDFFEARPGLPASREPCSDPFLAQKKTLITLKLELPDPDRAKKLGEKEVSRHCAGWGGNSRSLLSSFLGKNQF